MSRGRRNGSIYLAAGKIGIYQGYIRAGRHPAGRTVPPAGKTPAAPPQDARHAFIPLNRHPDGYACVLERGPYRGTTLHMPETRIFPAFGENQCFHLFAPRRRSVRNDLRYYVSV